MRLVETVAKSNVVGLAVQETVFLKNMQNAVGLLADEVNDGLIVPEGNAVPVESLARIFLLLKHKNVVVELALQPLVGVVDAQLLEAVGLQNLESENVEDTNEVLSFVQEDFTEMLEKSYKVILGLTLPSTSLDA